MFYIIVSRINNELRKIFLRLYKQGRKPIEIANTIDVTRQTITNWIRMYNNKGEKYFLELRYNNPTSRIDFIELSRVFENNPTLFNREIAEMFNCSMQLIHKYRHMLNYTNKKGSAGYKESKPELKKNSKKN